MTDEREADVCRLREIATEAARAGAAVIAASDDLDPIATKSTPTDIVTATDLAAERAIREVLAARLPGSRLLAEEGGHLVVGEGRANEHVEWIVDPLDGTVNFAYGLPVSAVSVAAAVGGRTVAATVIDVRRGDVYDAALGRGARRNAVPISPSSCATPAMALVLTGFAYDPDRRAVHGRMIAELLEQVRDIRAFGSAALHMCWVADGRADAYLERDIRPWDHAAGGLVASEAGARVELPCAENDHLTIVANAALRSELRPLLTTPAVLSDR